VDSDASPVTFIQLRKLPAETGKFYFLSIHFKQLIFCRPFEVDCEVALAKKRQFAQSLQSLVDV
jgi:hypothetical protein